MPLGLNCGNLYRQFNEYYTRYEHVKEIFEKYIPNDEIRDKIIYCPCDTDESNFVIYLKEHKDDLKYKELIYTSDDYNTHYDLFDYADVIVTNPPFSKLLKEFIPILCRCKKKFFILGSNISTQRYVEKFIKLGVNDARFIAPEKYISFILPEGCKLSNGVAYIYITNMDTINGRNAPKFDKKQKYELYAYIGNEKYRAYDKINYIPLDEYEPIIVPSSVQFEHIKKYFNILKQSKDIGDDIRFSDNKNRYLRVLVQRKK